MSAAEDALLLTRLAVVLKLARDHSNQLPMRDKGLSQVSCSAALETSASQREAQ